MSAIELRDEIEYRAFSYDRHEEAADNSVKFIEVFERVIDSRPTEGTKAIYRDTLNKVKKFARDEANSLTFEDIDYTQLRTQSGRKRQHLKNQVQWYVRRESKHLRSAYNVRSPTSDKR